MGDIALQIERTTSGSVAASGTVLFDTVVYSAGNIAYNTTTGVITLNETGRYIFNWWTATQSVQSTSGPVFALHSSQGDILEGNAPIKTGEVVGIGIIDVIIAPVTVSLLNDSGGTLYYSSQVPLTATLMLTKDQDAIKNLVDGNGFGSVRGIGTSDAYTMGQYAMGVGRNTVASGVESFSQGFGTTASGSQSHAEGTGTTASGVSAHAEGTSTTASGNQSHAEGVGTTSSGVSSHSEGTSTNARAVNSHAEGTSTNANGVASHAEGTNTTSAGVSSHAEGTSTTASGENSHAEGFGTSTNNFAGAHIMGQYGNADTAYSWFLAGGTSSGDPQLKCKILQDGNAYIDVAWNTGGADYAELFETADGQPIEPGYFVTFDAGDNKIRRADASDDYILGVVSAAAGFVGNTGELRWKNKYVTDEWGRIAYHEVVIPEEKDAEENVIVPEHIEIQPMLNPEWDPDKAYIPRQKRTEWVTVGLLGQLLLRDDGTCVVGDYCRCTHDGIATASEKGYRVIKRLRENQIMILLR